MSVMLALVAAATSQGVMDLSRGPVATTTVAVKVALDAEGRVVSCRPAQPGPSACVGFPRGRVVAQPLRRGGRPVGGTMTVSTTTVVSAR